MPFTFQPVPIAARQQRALTRSISGLVDHAAVVARVRTTGDLFAWQESPSDGLARVSSVGWAGATA